MQIKFFVSFLMKHLKQYLKMIFFIRSFRQTTGMTPGSYRKLKTG